MSHCSGLKKILSALRPGDRVFMAGSTGEVAPFTHAITSGHVPPLELTSSFVPGINVMSTSLPDGTTLTNPFPMATSGNVKPLLLSYGGYTSWLKRQVFDICIVPVASPNKHNRASLGTAVEFIPVAMSRAKQIIAVVNSELPEMPHSPALDLSDVSIVTEINHPLPEYRPGSPSKEAQAIASHISRFIQDGCALQVGLGKVPDALLALLTDRRGLRLQSGMISDGIRPLHEAGALDPDWLHMSCVQVGSKAHYDWLRGRHGFSVQGCEITHDPAVLQKAHGLIAVNSALEVDLSGQANLEFANGRQVSSVGGAPDFSRAASLDPQGVSVVGLPACAARGTISRIVPALQTPASLPRHDIEVVVTEHGAADLRGLSAEARADRLIAIAAPEHRRALAASWGDMNR